MQPPLTHNQKIADKILPDSIKIQSRHVTWTRTGTSCIGKIFICACALEPVPYIAVCGSGAGFLFDIFRWWGIEKRGGKNCKKNNRIMTTRRINDVIFALHAASTRCCGCCLRQRLRTCRSNANVAAKKALSASHLCLCLSACAVYCRMRLLCD